MSVASLRSRAARLAASLALAAGASACGVAPASFGSTAAEARANADDLFSAVALRFGPLRRDSILRAIRPRYVRNSLTPSRLWEDEALWSSIGDSVRTIAVRGTVVNGHYTLSRANDVQRPDRLGDARHVMRLRRLGEGEFAWHSTGELAIGGIGAGEFRQALTAILAAGEGRAPGELRENVRDHLPRASRAAGRLFSLDTLRATHAGGATLQTIGVRIHPERIRPVYPHFADYVEKYMSPARYHITVTDRAGGRWLEATARDELLMLRMRTRDGRLVPLTGAPRPVPDSLVLEISIRAKVKLFEIGVDRLRGDLTFVDRPTERGWMMRFRDEPEWRLPLITERLLRTPLQRPFQGQGVSNYLFVRDSAGAQTILGRDFRIAVQESAILRFLNGVGSRAMTDVTALVERERDAFVEECFSALRDDLVARLPVREALVRP